MVNLLLEAGADPVQTTEASADERAEAGAVGRRNSLWFPAEIASSNGHHEVAKRINAAAEAALGALEEVLDEGTATLPLCLGIARQFAIDSALMRDAEVISVVSSVVEEGGAASMIMLGNAVVSNRPFPGATPTRLSRRAAGIVE